MYSSSYSRAKFGLEAREPLHKPRGKSCGYYMRIIFFFSSLIQSLIIVSLVLFLIYGQPEKSAEEKRVMDLELGFNRLSDTNINLRKEKSEQAAQLAARTAEKAALEKEMAKLKNDSSHTEQDLKKKHANCERTIATLMARRVPPAPPPPAPPRPPVITSNSEEKALLSQQKADLINLNFTQTVQYLSQERDNALKDRDQHLGDVIKLRRDNTLLREQLASYTRKCKEDFALSLDGIQTVTKNFLNRINNLFPHQMTFHLTCDRQMEQMEKIRTSCTNLSRDVENKFQLYLDNVGSKVSEIQALSSQLEVLNMHLTSDLQQCNDNHREMLSKTSTDSELKQKAHDDQVERLLIEQNRLREQKSLLEDKIALREKELQILQGIPNNKVSENASTSPQRWEPTPATM